MHISRSGSTRYRGTKALIDNIPLKPNMAEEKWYLTASAEKNVRWDAATKEILITPRYIPLGDGHTHHNYTIRLKLQDVSALLNILGHVAPAHDAEALRDQLEKDVPGLVKLLACANSIVPTPMPKRATAAASATAAL